MPARQLANAVLEKAINSFLSTQPKTQSSLSELKGNRVVLFLDVFKDGLTLVFDDDVLVLNEPQTFVEAKENIDSKTCIIKTKLAVLSELSDSSQLTSLIQKGDLALVGDIAIAQKLTGLVSANNIDLEETLARYTSDVVAHTLFSGFKSIHKKVTSIASSLSVQAAEFVTEERPIAARKQGVEGVGMQIGMLRDDVDRVTSKMDLLETRISKDTQ
ncbi:SCP2 sterol-binding domain-containing protein [Alteromonas sp. 5E99-2]|uniref:ubiquinone biosynthesis accessory factor UbiJ n=1 Tax=Alteromonas sp. 5E99-2 TaxID=2817683 RepID=UPI001A99F0DE|nr:SCP2 sterol-binding domain-containing protein [Alteromonas sp. 5E99-2]MBO1256929.1 SCP2 sterol-binding domain-containing protein [Alteromonas sp. 5E99-2]